MRLFRCPLHEQGFTFNEILVAMAITGIGVLGYTATSVVVIRGNRASDNYTIAVNLAQDKLEQLKGRVTLANENRCPAAGDSGINTRGVPGGIFNRCWRIADSALGGSLKQIEVMVNWRDAEPHSVALVTLVYRD
ncbi:MAG: type IV pilus modification PilV family protein [Candidatus Binatia bacterium]